LILFLLILLLYYYLYLILNMAKRKKSKRDKDISLSPERDTKKVSFSKISKKRKKISLSPIPQHNNIMLIKYIIQSVIFLEIEDVHIMSFFTLMNYYKRNVFYCNGTKEITQPISIMVGTIEKFRKDLLIPDNSFFSIYQYQEHEKFHEISFNEFVIGTGKKLYKIHIWDPTSCNECPICDT
jgi:hypothetical protein